MKAEEFIDAVVAEIRGHGVTDWDVDYGHNHPRISFSWEDGIIVHSVPGSPSEQHGILNNLSLLRQRMGVKRLIAPKAAVVKKRPVKRRSVAVVLPELSGIVGVDPWAALGLVKASVVAGMVEAKALGRSTFHRGLCGSAPAGYPPHLVVEFLRGWRDGVWDVGWWA